MVEKLITFALRRRLLIIILTVLLIGCGIFSFNRLPIDAFPDVTNIQVQIISEIPGWAAEEVEKQVTFPIEVTMNGLPDITEVRSLSKFGLSLVTVVFKDEVDIYFARQLVLERLIQAKEQLPEGVDTILGPISTGLGEVYQYTIEGKDKDLTELRTIQDWVVRPILRTIPGVTDVNSFGGKVKQYYVNINPDKLLKYNLSLRQVFEAVANNNKNAGGNYIIHGQEQYIVRGLGLIQEIEDIKDIVITAQSGTPIYVKDVAEVDIGYEVRQGAAVKGGQDEAVVGIVLLIKDGNSRDVAQAVRKKVTEINQAETLGKGVKIVPFYDRTFLVERCLKTIKDALLEGMILVSMILFLFLWDFRSAMVVTFAIPLSVLFAFIIMDLPQVDLTSNLMTLGGLAIATGIVVDGATVMAENIYRHLSECSLKNKAGQTPISGIVLNAAKEVGRPILFAISIIIVVFLPLFTLEGMEGKMFTPLAYTITFALLGSILVSILIVPVLCSFCMRYKQGKENPVVKLLKRGYLPVLNFALDHQVLVIAMLITGFVLAGYLFVKTGTEFMPILEEGDMTIQVLRLPSTSLEESIAIDKKFQKLVLKFPEVENIVSKIGRAEIASDPMGPNVSDPIITLKPRDQWRPGMTKEKLIAEMREELEKLPGLAFNFTQPIALRVDELISGVKSQLAVKIFGEDLETLIELAEKVEHTLKEIPGARDVKAELVSGTSFLQIDIDRHKIARYGINVADVQEIIETAIGGKIATDVFEGQRRFAVTLRFAEDKRSNLQAIENLLVITPAGARIPLKQLAKVSLETGYNQISRENSHRRVVVQCNVSGRDVGGFVAEGKQRINSEIALPPGYYTSWGGQFENQERANRKLMIVVPIALLLILLLLFSSLSSVRHTFLIFITIPMALIGGITGLYFSGLNLSVPSSIGFIALLGIAVEDGLVMVTCFNQLRIEGVPLREALLKGGELRLRPVLITSITTGLGLIPLLLATGPGAEIQRPLAMVVTGGLVTSTLLTLIVLPVLYGLFEKASNPSSLS